jgi:cysteinyl-tRNA synthetase
MNITDVGHLVSDEDEGEDKMEKGAKKHGKSVWELAEYFTQDFISTMNAMNIQPANTICKATDHIADQIDMIKALFANGYAYETEEAVYFDVQKFPNYTKLNRQKLNDKQIGSRDEVNIDKNKRHPADFALWFKRIGKFQNHSMHWDSPWGDGFPGWHIECSAMSTKYLGDQFDIHTGGVDHISVHHTNEIAQSEAASGKSPFVKYWIHHEFLMVNGEKMSKSKGNIYRLVDLEDKGFDPMDLRYFFLTAQYRKPQNFTLEALEAAKNARLKLVTTIRKLSRNYIPETMVNTEFKERFVEAIEDDFNMPKALAIAWELLKSYTSDSEKLTTLLEFDKIFGLQLTLQLEQPHQKQIPAKAMELIEKRRIARENKDWAVSDELRERLLEEFGIKVEDK